ncbi:MAG: 3-hydroxyacyl-CoA dehydrogenase family protein [Clostridia bacterium]|nr:3-hydroxyacyl-CoA dehydrogenase family protein [Clostridia bacterium]
MKIEKIAVVGTGLMGKGIAHVFAAGNYKVDIFGRRDDINKEFYEYLNKDVSKGKMTEEQRDEILSNINFYNLTTQADSLKSCDLIIETVKEDLETKKDIFSTIAKYVGPNAIIASNTSSYSIGLLAEYTPYPQNFVGMHFFSPVPLMKLVEVVESEKTDSQKALATVELVKSIDKLPILVKDAPGFVLNRGLFIMVNEAICMLHEKIAGSAEDIDNIFLNGMGMKVGPLKLADLVGVDVVYAIMQNLYEGFKTDKYKPSPLLKTMADQGKFGRKSGEGFYKY